MKKTIVLFADKAKNKKQLAAARKFVKKKTKAGKWKKQKALRTIRIKSKKLYDVAASADWLLVKISK